MTITGVTFCGREQAEDMIPDPGVAIISITDPGPPAELRPGWLDKIGVSFYDFDKDEARRLGWVAEVRRIYPTRPFMSTDQAREIVDFVRRAEAEGATGIVVHCEAGVSRSAAVARWLAEKYRLELDPQSLHKHNKHVYRLLREADQ